MQHFFSLSLRYVKLGILLGSWKLRQKLCLLHSVYVISQMPMICLCHCDWQEREYSIPPTQTAWPVIVRIATYDILMKRLSVAALRNTLTAIFNLRNKCWNRSGSVKNVPQNAPKSIGEQENEKYFKAKYCYWHLVLPFRNTKKKMNEHDVHRTWITPFFSCNIK